MAEAGWGVVVADFAEVLVNGRWPLRLPPERASLPTWPWWEKERLLATRAAVRPGDVMVDVGAERGDLTALYGTWGADVIVVEPAAEAWPAIRATWNANEVRLPPLATFAGFLDETSSEGWKDGFRYRDWHPAAAGPYQPDTHYRHLDENDGNVPRATLDALMDAVKTSVRVVTMDVEGAEFRVLRGAQRTLALDRPTLLLSLHAEYMQDRYDEWSDDLRTWLLKVAGYDCVDLAFDHEAHLLCSARP